jgi:hypothetical protein
MIAVQAVADQQSGRRFSLIDLERLDQWPATLPGLGPRYGLLLACNAEQVASGVIAEVAERALASGAVSILAWGPGCERVHDIFDAVYAPSVLDQPDCQVVITTWHANESLDEALWYFVDVAGLVEPAADWLVVAVGHHDWTDQIRQRLSDLSGLRASVLSGIGRG